MPNGYVAPGWVLPTCGLGHHQVSAKPCGGGEICYRAADERIYVLDHGQPPGAGRRFPDGRRIAFQTGFAGMTVSWMDDAGNRSPGRLRGRKPTFTLVASLSWRATHGETHVNVGFGSQGGAVGGRFLAYGHRPG